jgi:hypothetical protein
MAACDNLYGNKKEWEELNAFLYEHKPEWAFYMRSKPEGEEQVRICYIADIQGWLIENCPLKWVKERLEEDFDVQRMICGKAHHERGEEDD